MAEETFSARQFGAKLLVIAELVVNAEHIWAIAGGILAAFGVLYSYLIHNEILLSIAVAVLFFVMGAVGSWNIATKRGRNRETATAEAFNRLQAYYLSFENELMKIGLLLATDRGKSPLSLSRLSHKQAEYLEQLCETAVVIFSASKGRRSQITSNIKVIELHKEENYYYYSVVARSGNTPTGRLSADRQRRLIENYLYDKVFNASYDRDYFLCDDVQALLNKMKRDGIRKEEPNEKSLGHYQSCLTVPVMGVNRLFEGVDRSTFSYCNGDKVVQEVFGLMCVDSTACRSFNENYDLAVMLELTSYAFSTFRLVSAIRYLANVKNVPISEV